VLLGISGFPAIVAAQGPTAAEGQTLFQEKCASCHTIGQGDLVGPDLKGVTDRRDVDWLTRWISAPDKMLAANDPTATALLAQYKNVPMPNLGLSQAQVEALIAYLAAPGEGTSAAGATLPAGDPARGKAYFVGQQRFANGGPPCMACHSVAGIGTLGGGRLGPDLTGAYNKWGQQGLVSFVTQPATVTMSTVWGQNPLTPQEGADLLAFLQQASVSQRPSDTVIQLTVLAAGVGALLLLLTHLVWRKRLVSVRRRMVASARH
jgi:mono/diheme cytochrome c family protein